MDLWSLGPITALPCEGMKPTVNIIGCGIGKPDLSLYRPILSEVDIIVLRTERHPGLREALDVGIPLISCDDLYDTSDTFEEVYRRAVDRVVELAVASKGSIAYIVPGSPTTAETTVRLLGQRQEITARILPRPGIIEEVLARMPIDPLLGLSVWDASELLDEGIPRVSGAAVILQAHSALLVQEISLMAQAEGLDVTFLHHLNLPDESVGPLTQEDAARADHLTTLVIDGLRGKDPLAKVRSTAKRLRTACPWDAQQTHASLSRHLLEEAHEVVEAIDELEASDEGDVHLAEELGDVLLQVLMHSIIADERGAFSLDDIAAGLDAKLIARHPHVFGDVVATDAATVVANWEKIKTQEKGRTSTLEGIPASLPEPLRLQKLLRKAQGLNLDSEDFRDAAHKTAHSLLEQDVLSGILSLCETGADINALLRRFNTTLCRAVRERETDRSQP